jgi:hypothetical protein
MPSRELHAALHAFAQQAAATLSARIASGEEIDFEVVVERAKGSHAGLYCYAPLTGEFVERHWDALLELPAARDAQMAMAALGDLDRYLDTYAREHRSGAPILQDALRCFARRVFEDGGEDFELEPARFEAAYGELRGGTEEPAELAVLALVSGIGLRSGSLEVLDGVLLAPLGDLDVLPPDPAWRHAHRPAVVAALEPPRNTGAIEEALGCLRDLQTALRLYAPGIALAPLAWIRTQSSVWRPLPIPGGGRGGGTLVIAAEQEEELRAFAAVVTRRRPAEGELAWALERFELGLERDDALGGLTDHLLALRALLEPEGPRSGRLAGRIAALCAHPQGRAGVTERVAHAISLEHSLIAGVSVGADALALAAEIEGHLRALLRDVICGHLAPQLVEIADSLVLEDLASGDQEEIRIRRVPRRLLPEAAELFDSAFDERDYCASEGDSTVLDPSSRPSR